MAAATGLRKSISSINDYPEHLNPFHEDDNHNRIRFWTIGRNKPSRSSSFSLNNIKDFRNTWSLKSFMKKNKKGHESQKDTKATPPSPVNGEASPVVYRRAIQYSSSPESTPASSGGGGGGDRYEYRGSVTPLPRSRFQERLRSTPPPALTGPNNFTHNAPGRASFSHRAGEPYALPGLARSELGGSRVSVESANPFEGDGTSPGPVPARRRKKRAAPLPPGHNLSITTSVTADQLSSVPAGEDDVKKKGDKDVGLDDPSLQIQLQIVEDVEETPSTDKVQPNTNELSKDVTKVKIQEDTEMEVSSSVTMEVATDTINNNSTKKETINTDKASVEIRNKKQDSIDSDNNDVVFEKVNIREYRRNSSFNSDSINLRNGNTEVSPLNNKRCKSLANTINANNTFTAYDITLHIDEDNNEVKDVNDNTPGPQKVVCKLFDGSRRSSRRKASADNSISSTEKEFIEIDRATRELEQEINKLNSSVKYMDDHPRKSNGMSVSEMKSRFENPAMYSPNPIPKPRRSRAGSTSPVSPRSE